MKRLVLVTGIALVLAIMPALSASVLAPTGTALAAAGGNATQHYGPYPSSSTDSSTCGNDWATDTFNREFTVRATGPNSFTIVEDFKDGSFVTMAGASPGGCDTNVGGTIVAGVTGKMHGSFDISNVGAQMSTSPYCNAVAMSNTNCDTTTFVNTHFNACYPTTCTVTTFLFHYSAGGQGLAEHEWKNASCDRGGNQGDIASTDGVEQKSALCP